MEYNGRCILCGSVSRLDELMAVHSSNDIDIDVLQDDCLKVFFFFFLLWTTCQGAFFIVLQESATILCTFLLLKN